MPTKLDPVPGGVSAPDGFLCNAVACGIKNPAVERLDLALIYSERPAVTVAAFTTNRVKAAPVRVSQQNMRTNSIRAIIANSGNANACTGPRGIADAKAMSRAAAEGLGLTEKQVLVNSTGIIGVPLPIDRITPKIDGLVNGLARKRNDAVAKAIMTSDTKPKSVAVKVPVGKKTVTIGGVCKGAGMICPSMATMLCFITTDANIGKAELKKAMDAALDRSFNRINIDGDMSTNDTVIVMANGAAGNRKLQNGTPSAKAFREGLHYVMVKLAKMIVGDGERVTKFVEVRVKGAKTHLDARRVAETVSKSLLVKSSWNGEDPNWGRVIHAVGYARAQIREELIDIYFDGLCACTNGLATDVPYEELKKVVENRQFTLTIDLNLGDAGYYVFSSDISPEYVDFNRTEYAAVNPS